MWIFDPLFWEGMGGWIKVSHQTNSVRITYIIISDI